jgi:ATPase involved in DNA repair
MKILAIRGRNIASLEGDFEIDFTKEPLCSNGIFAITGHTGAGKSTLLDALCISLYEQAPRLSQSNSREIADVGSFSVSSNSPLIFLRRGATEGYTEVDFVGVDGDTYRSRWAVWRANRRIDRKIQPAVMSLSNLTKNTEIDGKKTELLLRISSLVGLSYEQFTRSVLLAQGEFASFLKANDNTRATLLEKLTGTEIYSTISKLIFERTKDALSDYENVKLRMSEHHLLSPDELEQKQLLEKSLTNTDSELTARSNKLTEQQRWYERFHTIQNQIQQTKAHIEESGTTIRSQSLIRKQMEDLNTLSVGIQCCKDLNRLASEKNQLDEREKELLVQKEESEKQFSNKKREYDSLKDDYNRFVSQEGSLLDELKKAREIDVLYANKQLSLSESLHQLNGKKQQVEEKKQSIDNIKSEINSATKSFTEADNWLNENRSRREVAENFNVICQHLNSAVKIKKDIATNDGKLVQKSGEIESLQKESDKQKANTSIARATCEEAKELIGI